MVYVNTFSDAMRDLDCYLRKLPDEPHFTLLARDPEFAAMVRKWAKRRERAVDCGLCPPEDRARVLSAREIAAQGVEWRRQNNGKWRNPPPTDADATKPPETTDIPTEDEIDTLESMVNCYGVVPTFDALLKAIKSASRRWQSRES